MKKETRNFIIFIVVSMVLILAIVIPFVIKNKKEDERLKETFSKIGNSATEYVEETESSNSHLNEFTYNTEIGEVEYKPVITLEMYNRIEKGMTKEEVISILGKEDNTISEDEGESYLIEYGDSFLKKGYWIQFTIDNRTNQVVNKNEVGLK